MNKTKRGFLLAGVILTIIASAFALFDSIELCYVSRHINEDAIKDTLISEGYTMVEEAETYYLTDLDATFNVKIYEDDIQKIASWSKWIWVGCGAFVLAFSISKLIIAISILKLTHSNRYSKGKVIALLVLNAISLSLLETAFLIVVLCLKNKQDNQETDNQLKKDDIELKDI